MTTSHKELHSIQSSSDYASRTSIILPCQLYFFPQLLHPAYQISGPHIISVNTMSILPSKAVSSALSHIHLSAFFSFCVVFKRMVDYLHASYKCSFQPQNQKTRALESSNLSFKQGAQVIIRYLKFQDALIY